MAMLNNQRVNTIRDEDPELAKKSQRGGGIAAPLRDAHRAAGGLRS